MSRSQQLYASCGYEDYRSHISRWNQGYQKNCRWCEDFEMEFFEKIFHPYGLINNTSIKSVLYFGADNGMFFFLWPTNWNKANKNNITCGGTSINEISNPVKIREHREIKTAPWSNSKAIISSAFDILNKAFNSPPVIFRWDMHKMRQFINWVRKIRPSKG